MRPAVIIFVVVQLVLLGVEVLTDYDTTGRQTALAVTNVASIIGVLWLDRHLRKQGSHLSALTLLIVAGGIWLDALGNFQHFYGRWWWYDRLTHGVGGMAVTAFFTDVFLARQRIGQLQVTRGAALWLGFLLGQFVGSMYEVSEWIGDELFATHRVQGLFDAPRDLLNNAVGGVVATVLFWLTQGKK
jgi:hypothetical protein